PGRALAVGTVDVGVGRGGSLGHPAFVAANDPDRAAGAGLADCRMDRGNGASVVAFDRPNSCVRPGLAGTRIFHGSGRGTCREEGARPPWWRRAALRTGGPCR